MSRKLALMGVIASIFSFFGCEPKGRETVSYQEFLKSPSKSVLIKLEDDVQLKSLIKIETKTRLKSKTVTEIRSDLYYSTNNDDLLLLLPRSKRIEKHLKTTRDRRPYVNSFENQMRNSSVSNIKISSMEFELAETLPDYATSMVLRQVKDY